MTTAIRTRRGPLAIASDRLRAAQARTAGVAAACPGTPKGEANLAWASNRDELAQERLVGLICKLAGVDPRDYGLDDIDTAHHPQQPVAKVRENRTLYLVILDSQTVLRPVVVDLDAIGGGS